MLKSANIRNFTVFPEAALDFDERLNVFIGENGTGKSHLLKLLYSVLAASAEEGKIQPSRPGLSIRLEDKLIRVFRPDHLGRLPRRGRGIQKAEVSCKFHDSNQDVKFQLLSKERASLVLHKEPNITLPISPVFLPTRELLSIFPGFVALYEERYLDFEETWRDTCRLLAIPALRGPREARVKEVLAPLEEAMNGSIELDKNGRFYLNAEDVGRIEMHLVAEGLRKLAMLARLIATGALLDQGYLFWDEPESNLNPKLIKEVAKSIIRLSQSGIQVFIATHSLFLMRELDIQLQKLEPETSAHFFGLHFSEGGVEVRQSNSIDDVGSIAALDEQLLQSDRYLEVEG